MARNQNKISKIKQGEEEKLRNIITEYVETEKTFFRNCDTFVNCLQQLQKKKPFSEDTHLQDMIEIFSKISDVSKEAVGMTGSKNDVEGKLTAIKEGYTADYAKKYFDALLPAAVRNLEFLNWFENLNDNNKKTVSDLLEKTRQAFQSFLIMPIQRGPRHKLLFEEMNKRTVGKMGYLGLLIENVKSRATLLNEEISFMAYVKEKGISNDELKKNEFRIREIVSARSERAALDEKVSTIGGLVSGGILSLLTKQKKDFVDNVLTDLSVEWHKAKKNGNWDGYISKIEKFNQEYKEQFGEGKGDKMGGFLNGLKADAEILKNQENENNLRIQAEHANKFSPVLRELKSRLPQKVLGGISDRAKGLIENFSEINKKFETKSSEGMMKKEEGKEEGAEINFAFAEKMKETSIEKGRMLKKEQGRLKLLAKKRRKKKRRS